MTNTCATQTESSRQHFVLTSEAIVEQLPFVTISGGFPPFALILKNLNFKTNATVRRCSRFSSQTQSLPYHFPETLKVNFMQMRNSLNVGYPPSYSKLFTEAKTVTIVRNQVGPLVITIVNFTIISFYV